MTPPASEVLVEVGVVEDGSTARGDPGRTSGDQRRVVSRDLVYKDWAQIEPSLDGRTQLRQGEGTHRRHRRLHRWLE
jgi:hypothetical protein